jgi:hypothetical protein
VQPPHLIVNAVRLTLGAGPNKYSIRSNGRYMSMKILQVIPRANKNVKLKALLKTTERELRGGTTTFVRQKEGRWKHKRYPGWINWDETQGGVLVAEVKTVDPKAEWQLLQAFIGYLDRHLSDHIESVSITYR